MSDRECIVCHAIACGCDPGIARDVRKRMDAAHDEGAAVAFGLMGMAEAIRARCSRPFEWLGGRAYPPRVRAR